MPPKAAKKTAAMIPKEEGRAGDVTPAQPTGDVEMPRTLTQAKALTNDQLATWLIKMSEAYYNDQSPLVSDAVFDKLKDLLEERDPQHPALQKLGHSTTVNPATFARNKVDLPVTMWSMDKIKAEPAVLASFVKKYPGTYVASDKLDGISALYLHDAEAGGSKLYTRGDGRVGQDISHLLPYIRQSTLPTHAQKGTVARCEMVISKPAWEEIKHLGKNARNVVAGNLNAKTPVPEILSRIDMVAYELIEPKGLPPAEQFARLNAAGFTTAANQVLAEDQMKVEALSDVLLARKRDSPYEVDGIVVVHNVPHPRKLDGNPDYAFAFKSLLTQEEAEVVIKEVEWNISKDRLAKPLAKFAKVKLAGVDIGQATLFNAAFVEANVIGPGSRVVIIRAGDVIPHIVRVLGPSTAGVPALPTAFEWRWNETHVDIVASGASADEEIALKELTHFFEKIDVDGVGPGVVAKLFAAGYKTVRAVVAATEADLLRLEGVKEKMATKIVGAVREAMGRLTPLKLMVASNAFGRGFGERRLKLIMEHCPFDRRQVPTEAALVAIQGIEAKTAGAFLEALPRFWEFVEANRLEGVFKASPVAAKPVTQPATAALAASKPTSQAAATPAAQAQAEPQKLAGAVVVFTGFRDAGLEARVEELGGRVATSISGKTTMVVMADDAKPGGKVAKAETMGIKVLTRSAFEALLE